MEALHKKDSRTTRNQLFFLILLSVSSIVFTMQAPRKRQSRAITDDKELSNEAFSWICPFNDSVIQFDESGKWYKFLNSLYCKLSEYEIQVRRSFYDVTDVEDWGKTINEGGLVIDKNNFEIFLNKIADYSILEYDSIKHITITELHLEELNHVLDLTIKDRFHVSCKESQLFVKGNFITITDIYRKLLMIKLGHSPPFTFITVDDNCKDVLTIDRFKFINIFALNTIFIDQDVKTSIFGSKYLEVPLTIIAPKWEILGTHKIELSGDNGKLPEVEAGIDGKPGNPGGPGGNFFGIGKNFHSGAKLTISVVGGDGSRGQNGKNGRHGKEGITPTVPSGISCHKNLCLENKRINLFRCKKDNCDFYGSANFSGSVSTLKNCRYKIYGDNGTDGTSGGRGGKGGKGGNPGNIVLYELNNDSGISKISNTGLDGKDGRGGAPGIGGKRGNDIIVSCKNKIGVGVWALDTIVNTKERATSGRRGSGGTNSEDMKKPEASIGIDKLDKAKIINQYKSYLLENLNAPFTKGFLTEFLKELDNNSDVKSTYDALGLIDELQNLERQFYKLNIDVDLLPFYQSLLNRIIEYAQNPIEVGDPNQYKKVLGYLYTATLGRIYNLQENLEDNLESNLIIDITDFLEAIKNDIDKLKDLRDVKNREEVINKYKQEYKHEIDRKIKETKELISKEITLEMNFIGNNIDTEIEYLINYVIYLEEYASSEDEELTKIYQQLKEDLLLQCFLGYLKILNQVVRLIGPAEEIAGSVIETGSTIFGSFFFENSDDQHDPLQLPQSVHQLESIKYGIKAISDQRFTYLKKTLENISQEVNSYLDRLRNITLKIAEIRDKLEKTDGFNFINIQDLQNDLKLTLQGQKIESFNEESVTDEIPSIKLGYLDILKKSADLSTVILDYYSKYKHNQAKHDIIRNIIKQNEDKFRKIKQYEEQLYNTIQPMLQNIQTDLDDTISKLGTKSKVALDVTKWQVKSTLGDMMFQMQQFSREFEIQGNLARHIEKLKDDMLIIIDAHNYIQDYQKYQNFANFIAGISSITTADINIDGVPKREYALRKALRDLDITLRSSIVVNRHKIAIDAFKQFVFPFAHVYLKGLMRPAHLELGGNNNKTAIDILVSQAENQIEHMQSKLEEYKASVKINDGCIFTGVFSSSYFFREPFFVWKNEKYKNIISKLLAGEVVVVKADILNSDPKKDAIKLSYIELVFKSKNETLQSELNNVLDGFEITATHLGNSYYRYNDKIYLIKTVSREFSFSLKKKPNGEPVETSSSYDKIQNGDIMISPYASWKIKLNKKTDNISFKDLEIYYDTIHLELGGIGKFIYIQNSNCLNFVMEPYYKAFETYIQED